MKIQICLLQTCVPTEVVVLPPNIASLIQPIDQGVIANVKAYYFRRTFRKLIDKTDNEDKQSIRQFWKDCNKMNTKENIIAAWREVTTESVSYTHLPLCPAYVPVTLSCGENRSSHDPH